MRRKPRGGGLILLAVIIAGFLSGVVHLFLLRFEAGDSYPVYSSLRADPLGSKALYDSLGSLEGVVVSRNYQPLSRLGQYPDATLFLFGMPASSLNDMGREEARALESFALGGNRLVLLLYPEKPRARQAQPAQNCGAAEKDKGGEQGPEKDAPGKGPKKGQDGRKGAGSIDLAEGWKVGLSWEEPSADADGSRRTSALPAPGQQGLVGPLSWHSSLRFEGLGAEWKALYEVDGKAVVIERAYGKGTIVLASDSWFVSNEALVKERRPGLLARLVGPNSAVIFDETHFGIRENPGVAALGRKYRLQGLFAGLLLLAALFIWKNSMSLVPPGEGRPERSAGAQGGRDSLAGLAGLLRRTVPQSDILAACAEEWKKTNRKGAPDAAGDAALVESIMANETKRPARGRDPVRAYRQIHTLLAERKGTI
jgi:Domain of unknown function (DUF4350)